MESQFSVDGKHIWRCPQAVFNEMSIQDKQYLWRLLNYFWWSEKGILPKAGGLDDQDQRIMSFMPLIGKYRNEFQMNQGREGK